MRQNNGVVSVRPRGRRRWKRCASVRRKRKLGEKSVVAVSEKRTKLVRRNAKNVWKRDAKRRRNVDAKTGSASNVRRKRTSGRDARGKRRRRLNEPPA